MTAKAGFQTVPSFSTDDISYTAFTNIKSVSGLVFTADDLDTTSFGDGQWKTRIQGLKEMMPKLEGQWEIATAQTAARAAFTSGATVYLKVLYDGTNGFKIPCIVESYEVGSAVDGLVTFSLSLASNGAPTFLP